MKYLISILLLLPLCVNGQSITKKEIDPYTKTRKLSTSRERLGNSYFRTYFYKIKNYGDDLVSIEFEIIMDHPFSVRKGEKAIFLFDDNVSLMLDCTRSDVSYSYWKGNVLNNVAYPLYDIPNEYIKHFLEKKVKGVRIYYNDTYVSMDKIRRNHAEVFQKAIKLIYDEI